MKIAKRILPIVVSILLLVLCLSSCAPSIKGKWSYATDEGSICYEFASNGKLFVTTSFGEVKNTTEAEYKLKDDTITISINDTTYPAKYSIEKNTLKLGDMLLKKVVEK